MTTTTTTTSMATSEEAEEEEAAAVVVAAFPKAVPHTITTCDENGRRRQIRYYTFDTQTDTDAAASSSDNNGNDDAHSHSHSHSQHPVLYLHGFPGCGLEGRLCARQVAEAGGKLFALDRPGFGETTTTTTSPCCTGTSSEKGHHHDPSLLYQDDERIMEQAINDIWTVMAQENWKQSSSFSMIGVSGGGPYTLGFLRSYLDRCCHSTSGGDKMPPKLRAISLVGALCCVSEGVVIPEPKDVLPDIKMITQLVAHQESSAMARFQLRAMFGMTSFLVRMLPTSFLEKMTYNKPQLPPPDQAVFRNDKTTVAVLVDVMVQAMRQGSAAVIQEACCLFRKNVPSWMRPLEEYYQESNDSSNSSDITDCFFPDICLHHGKLDVNVPLAHAEYTYEQILCGCQQQSSTTTMMATGGAKSIDSRRRHRGTIKLVVYEDMGHFSLLTNKTNEIARFAVHGASRKG